jgi:hypothetical protein
MFPAKLYERRSLKNGFAADQNSFSLPGGCVKQTRMLKCYACLLNGKKHWIRRLQTIFHVDTKPSFIDFHGVLARHFRPWVTITLLEIDVHRVWGRR